MSSSTRVLVLVVMACISGCYTLCIPDSVVYDDALAPGFNDFTWADNYTLEATGVNDNIFIDYKPEQFDAIYISCMNSSINCINTTEYIAVRFRARVAPPAASNATVRLQTRVYNKTKVGVGNANYNVVGTEWTNITIAFQMFPLNAISGFIIQESLGEMQPHIHIDDIWLVGTCQNESAPTISPTASPVSLLVEPAASRAICEEDLDVYLDGPTALWADWSWFGTNYDFFNVDVVYEGDTAVSFEGNMEQDWAVYFHCDNCINVTHHHAIEFWIAASMPGARVQFQLVQYEKPLEQLVAIGPISNMYWTKHVIEFSELTKNINGSLLDGLWFKSNIQRPITIFIDSIRILSSICLDSKPVNEATRDDSNSSLPLILGIVFSIVGATILGILILLVAFWLLKPKKMHTFQANASPTAGVGASYATRPSPAGSLNGSVATGINTAPPQYLPEHSDEYGLLPVDMPEWNIPFSELTLGQKIGSGRQGNVYKGTYNGDQVAVKMSQSVSKKESQDEAKLMTSIPGHSNVVQMLGITIDDSKSYIVMELVNGGSLKEYASRAKITPKIARELALGIACGMLHLHEHNIIHRDLACRNILMDGDTPKISDFGMSADFSSLADKNLKSGPIPWMSPEAIRCDWSFSSDVWSYGIVIWQLFNKGKKPHSGVPLEELATQIRDEGLVPEINEDKVPEYFVSLMKSCWRKDVKERPSFGEVVQDL